jgi:hypothetical protein
MFLKRLMMMPRFCFSEAAQTIEGIFHSIKDINLLLLLILLQVVMLDHFSLLLQRAMLCRQLQQI